MGKPDYTKPASQVWAEQQEKNGNASPKVLSTFSDEAPDADGGERQLTVEGNQTGAYVGTDPIYQNYANETEAPLKAEKGIEATLEKRNVDTVPTVPSRDSSEGDGSGDGDGSTPPPSGLTTGVQTPNK